MEAKRKESAVMKRHLVRQFGQAKGQRMYEQAEFNKVDEEAVGDRVAEAAMDVDEDRLTGPQDRERAEKRDRLIPPINR